MQTVAGMERVFLGIESDDFPMDGAALLIVDPSTAGPDFGFESIRAAFVRGLPRAPVLTRRIVEPPTPAPGTGFAYWVDDPDFDLDAHLDRVTVPAPGDRAALARLCVELSAGPRLPRDRPLWRAWYVDGLADGLAALILRFHHAAVDGIAAVEMFAALLDTEPRPAPDAPVEPSTRPLPGAAALLLRSLRDTAVAPAVAARETAALGAGLVAGRIAGGDRPKEPIADGRPSLFNRPIERPDRSLALLELPFAEAKAVKNALKVPLTDLVLAMITASLRRYLLDRGEPVDGGLSALCPVNARTGGERNGSGNHWAVMFNGLPVQLADPLKQLAAIGRETSANKRASMAQARFVNPADAIAAVVPPVTWPLVGRLLASPPGRHLPPVANLSVSSIPGAPTRLYLAGASVLHLHNRAFTMPGSGLFIAYVGYCDTLDVGITATRELVPDPERIADGMREHLTVLGALARAAQR